MTINETISTYRREFGIIPLIVLAGSCAFILMYWITDLGPGVTADSTVYIKVARSLLAGNGFFGDFVGGGPMTHFPPGYPLLIAGIDLLYPGDTLQATRFLAALLFSVNLVLFVLAVYICTRRSLLAVGCALLIFLFSAEIIAIHSTAWSEPPFITFFLASLLLFSYHVRCARLHVLVLAGLMAGFAAATRYVGVALLPTIALAFFLLDNRSIKSKMRELVIFACIVSLPLACWFIRNILLTHSATNREFAFHPIGLDNAKTGVLTMADFILPGSITSISPWTKAIHIGVAVAFFLCFLWGGAIIYRKAHSKQNATSMGIVLPLLCVIYYVIHVVFLALSISFFDASTPLDCRVLLPAILALTIASITLAWSLSEALNRRWIWSGYVLLVLFCVSIKAPPSIAMTVHIHKNGTEYTSRYWKHSDIIAYLSDSHESRPIYSNGPDAINFLTGKETAWLPAKVNVFTGRANENYEEELKQMMQKCREGKALIVYFNALTWRSPWFLPSSEELESRGNLPVLSRTPYGVIYGTR